ncbi:MAG: EAL domain-containing protein [gamma proteobacterium symbiont of Taylorina sp.]|nr:EAL domain-containing protein [gamma proteobacterium symbiont of Taylorina sp.]
MNLKVIAEGVETPEQKEFLQKPDCEEMQGYLYGKPVTADEMTKLLSSNVIKYKHNLILVWFL